MEIYGRWLYISLLYCCLCLTYSYFYLWLPTSVNSWAQICTEIFHILSLGSFLHAIHCVTYGRPWSIATGFVHIMLEKSYLYNNIWSHTFTGGAFWRGMKPSIKALHVTKVNKPKEPFSKPSNISVFGGHQWHCGPYSLCSVKAFNFHFPQQAINRCMRNLQHVTL